MSIVADFLCSLVPFSDQELSLLNSLFVASSWSKKSYFARSGDYPHQVALVESGVLRAFFRNDQGEEYNKTFFRAGTMVGAYSALVSSQQNQINLQCLTDCKLWVVDYQQLTALYDEYHLVERLARLLAEQFFVLKEKREIELVTLDARARYQIFQQEHPGLEQQIPLYHIASYLGVSATQLSRIRAKR
ncbi:MAG: Crp/Fnr family transcriptional regulator [Bacteroidota bacterium]